MKAKAQSRLHESLMTTLDVAALLLGCYGGLILINQVIGYFIDGEWLPVPLLSLFVSLPEQYASRAPYSFSPMGLFESQWVREAMHSPGIQGAMASALEAISLPFCMLLIAGVISFYRGRWFGTAPSIFQQ